jgi:hypothetical protein|nr:MAG TPA: Bacterial PH domain protein [Caudoviricetes sp.]
MINFNKNSVWNLRPINVNEVRNELYGLLLNDEVILSAFKTIRDQLVFTNKRIVAIDVQGITGSKRSFSSLPYSKVQFFAIQTPSVMEMVKDSELYLEFSSGFSATFEFKGDVDIGQIGRMVSKYVIS